MLDASYSRVVVLESGVGSLESGIWEFAAVIHQTSHLPRNDMRDTHALHPCYPSSSLSSQ